MSIFKDCDIRGIYDSEINEESVYRIGRGLAAMLPPGGEIRVGGDVRLSTPSLKESLIAGLVRGGARVAELGVIPTPVLYYALSGSSADAGATVTASHNPPEYNGIKFMFGHEPVARRTIDALEDIVTRGAFADGEGSVSRLDILPAYLASLSKRFGARRPLKVVIDAGNGTMSAVAPVAFRSAGYRVTELFCEPDGAFPNRSPNPAEHSVLGALCEKVVEVQADFGVAFDGDGDRAAFVDEKGRCIHNEKALILFVKKLLADRPTPVVFDQKSSSAVRDAILSMGGAPVAEKSGHAFIKKRFLELGAAVAGEASGHFFFGDLGYDDGLYAALLMAELLCASDKPLSALSDEIFLPPITPDLRFFCPYARQNDVLARFEAHCESLNAKIHKLDGVRAELPDGWMLLRKSVTAEQMTLRIESRTEEQLSERLRAVQAAVPEIQF